MKTKSYLLLFTAASVFTVLILNRYRENNWTAVPKAAMNVVKCTSTRFLLSDVDSTKQIAPLFENLGKHVFPIQTAVKEAQTYFDQGLNLAFAFNHAESHRSFLEASRLDPVAAMAYWGQAYALGPNINDQVPDAERRVKAHEAVIKAMTLAGNAPALEQDLIRALSLRYSADTLAELKELNLAYMKAMEGLAAKYNDNADVLTLYAAAVMNTVPWDYWDKDGKPSPNIPEAKLALERAVTLDPDHPGAHHYFIHMVELPQPDLGVPSAERLAGLMPGAGHLVHMPGHIYMRVGRYADAVKANQDAILVDEDYISQCFAQGMYPLGYYPHNIHFLWSAASMMGNSRIAIDAAKKTAEKVPYGELASLPFLQNFAATPLLAYTRFGRWNDVLTIPYPGDEYVYLKLIWNYARGMAFVRKKNLKEAREELEAIASRDRDQAHEKLAQVAYEVLAGEIEALNGDLSAAIDHMGKAVAHEDELPYEEPSLWYIPTRQSLGRLQLKAGLYAEAEKTYLEDLEYYRENGWSLIGLYHSLKGQKKEREAEAVLSRFREAWKNADMEISSSVL